MLFHLILCRAHYNIQLIFCTIYNVVLLLLYVQSSKAMTVVCIRFSHGVNVFGVRVDYTCVVPATIVITYLYLI